MSSKTKTERRLHIGGKETKDGWEILDAIEGPHVNHLGDARNLSCFGDCTFVAVYASHVLEHFDYQEQIFTALTEWHRVLQPGGTIYISVPDLECLCRLYLRPGILPMERLEIMRLMFGGHMDDYDYHLVGIDQTYLAAGLQAVGFVAIQRVETFGLFQDTSEYCELGTPISLNMVAQRPLQA